MLVIMAVSEEFEIFIVDLLSPLGDITSNRLFSGLVFKCDGKQVGVAFDDQFYFRVQKELEEKYKAYGSKPFRYMKKNGWVTVKAYYLTPEEVLENQEEFLEWAHEVLEAAE